MVWDLSASKVLVKKLLKKPQTLFTYRAIGALQCVQVESSVKNNHLCTYLIQPWLMSMGFPKK